MAKEYISEITQFINQLKHERPYLEKEQQEGRARLWDKNINTELQEGYKQARVKQRPYVYQTEA